MERLQTKRTVTRVELQKLIDELMQLRTADALELHQEDRIAEMKEELEALAKEMKQLDALIEPHVCDEDLAEEYGGVRKNQGLITHLMSLRIHMALGHWSTELRPISSSILRPDSVPESLSSCERSCAWITCSSAL
ncbi:hypothetical protein HPB50_026068 [Hyalomma asiaticum]|uniref:Uncharacterized protein n=1 Tax=Hyalomma asiaticum TaxID=266040 RepID=A0ACB7T7K0_HYAAI|nr:hypothetical protein HPB50_026068 [Hyalomma asiaticum]